eukprot:tig00000821_g4497.t1
MGCCSSKPKHRSAVDQVFEVVVQDERTNGNAPPPGPRPLSSAPQQPQQWSAPGPLPNGATASAYNEPLRPPATPAPPDRPLLPPAAPDRPLLAPSSAAGKPWATPPGATPRASEGGSKPPSAPVSSKPTFSAASPLHDPPGAVSLERLPEMIALLSSEDVERQLLGARRVRKLLSAAAPDAPERTTGEAIGPVVSAGVCPRLVQLLRDAASPELRFEAAWALTNVASGASEHTRHVADCDAVPPLVETLRSDPDPSCRDQAAWALGNIAGDGAELRDAVLGAGGLPPLVAHVEALLARGPPALPSLRQAVWSLSNLARNRPKPPLGAVRGALPALARVLAAGDEEASTDAAWAVCYISDTKGEGGGGGHHEGAEALLGAGLLAALVGLLSHASARVQTPALRAIGHLLSGSEAQTQAVVECPGASPPSRASSTAPPPRSAARARPARPPRSSLSEWPGAQRAGACRTWRRGRRGSWGRCWGGAVPRLAELARDPAEAPDTRREALWALANASHAASRPQLTALAEAGAIAALCEALGSPPLLEGPGADPRLPARPPSPF